MHRRLLLDLQVIQFSLIISICCFTFAPHFCKSLDLYGLVADVVRLDIADAGPFAEQHNRRSDAHHFRAGLMVCGLLLFGSRHQSVADGVRNESVSVAMTHHSTSVEMFM